VIVCPIKVSSANCVLGLIKIAIKDNWICIVFISVADWFINKYAVFHVVPPLNDCITK